MGRPRGKAACGEAGAAAAGEERVRVRSRWRHLPPGPAATVEDDAQLPDVTEAFKQYLGKQRKASTRYVYTKIVSKLFGQHHRSWACMGTSNFYYAFVEESNRGYIYALKWFRSFWAVRSSRLTKQGQTRKAPDAETKPGSDTAKHTEDQAGKEFENEVSSELKASAAQAPDAEAKTGSNTAMHTEDHAEKELQNAVSFELKASAVQAPDAEAKPGSDTAKHTEDQAGKELKNEVSFESKASAAQALDAEAKPGSNTATHTEDHAEQELQNEVSFELKASAAQAPDAEAKPGSDTAKHTEDHAEKEFKNEVSFELKASAAQVKVGREQEDELGPSGDVHAGLLRIEQPSGMSAPTTPPAIPSRGHKHARSEGFHSLTGQIVRVDWSSLKTIRPKELPAIEDLFPADTETLTSAELRHYERQLKWHTKRAFTERLEKLSKELQTNTLPWASPASQSNEGSLGPQAFGDMAADKRLQLRSEELKHLEQQMLIMDGEHLTVQERRDRLKDHVRKLAGAATPKEKQVFMQQWLDTAESTRFGVTVIDADGDAPGAAGG